MNIFSGSSYDLFDKFTYLPLELQEYIFLYCPKYLSIFRSLSSFYYLLLTPRWLLSDITPIEYKRYIVNTPDSFVTYDNKSNNAAIYSYFESIMYNSNINQSVDSLKCTDEYIIYRYTYALRQNFYVYRSSIHIPLNTLDTLIKEIKEQRISFDLLTQYSILLSRPNSHPPQCKSHILKKLHSIYYDHLHTPDDPLSIIYVYIYLYSHVRILDLPYTYLDIHLTQDIESCSIDEIKSQLYSMYTDLYSFISLINY